jgi:hypothetical protein
MFAYHLDQNLVIGKAVQAVQSLRLAFEQIETFSTWLGNNPVVDNVDPLVTVYNFSADEAYALRFYFENMENVRTSNEAAFDIGRKITGLIS